MKSDFVQLNVIAKLLEDKSLQANDVVFCGRILMFLAHFFPLSERSGLCLLYVMFPLTSWIRVTLFLMYTAVNIKGVFNTSNETKYEKEAPKGIATLKSIGSFYMCTNADGFFFFISLRHFYRFQLLQDILEFTGE